MELDTLAVAGQATCVSASQQRAQQSTNDGQRQQQVSSTASSLRGLMLQTPIREFSRLWGQLAVP